LVRLDAGRRGRLRSQHDGPDRSSQIRLIEEALDKIEPETKLTFPAYCHELFHFATCNQTSL